MIGDVGIGPLPVSLTFLKCPFSCPVRGQRLPADIHDSMPLRSD
jgi:hypothetical protein